MTPLRWLLPSVTSGAACQFALMAARALSFGISVVNGKRQSDDHDDQNDEFIVAHMITPFVQRGSQPSAIFFLPAGGCPRIQLITYIYHLSTFLYGQKQPRGTLPCAALTCFIVHAIITAGRDDASALASPLCYEWSRLSVRADGGSCFILWDFRCEWKTPK